MTSFILTSNLKKSNYKYPQRFDLKDMHPTIGNHRDWHAISYIISYGTLSTSPSTKETTLRIQTGTQTDTQTGTLENFTSTLEVLQVETYMALSEDCINKITLKEHLLEIESGGMVLVTREYRFTKTGTKWVVVYLTNEDLCSYVELQKIWKS
jgi:hypothetical protein